MIYGKRWNSSLVNTEIYSAYQPLKQSSRWCHPEYARYILQDNSKNYHKSLAYDVLKVLLGNGLLTSEGEFWKKQRRLAQPAFHRRKLKAFAMMMILRRRNCRQI